MATRSESLKICSWSVVLVPEEPLYAMMLEKHEFDYLVTLHTALIDEARVIWAAGLELAPSPRLIRTVPMTVPKIAAKSTKEDTAMMIACRQLVLLPRAPSSTLP